MGTYVPSGKDIDRKWYVLDANGKTLGRLATKAADVLSGKLNPRYVPYIDTGDHVIVINAEKVRLTGNKMADKEYQRYSLHPGGQTREPAEKLMARKPYALLEHAVRGMLPKTRLGRAQFNNLHVIVGTEHKHSAQKPRKIDLNTIK